MRLYLIYFIIGSAFIVAVAFSHHSNGEIHTQKLGKYNEMLDEEGKFIVHWSIAKDNQSVTFDVMAKTKGFVGFGITLDGTIKGADIFIGGIRVGDSAQETTYSGDYHGSEETGQLYIDEKSNWGLVDAQENHTHTYIRITRLLDTCDPQDIPIRETGTTRLFWILGKSDWDIEGWKEGSYGSKFTNIFPLPLPELDISQFKVWEIASDTVYPDREHAHWCIIRQGPRSVRKLHLVGYEPIYGSEEAVEHTHHHTLKLCTPPPGVSADELFGPLTGSDGADCFNNNHTFPSQFCQTGIITQLSGGKRVLFPERYGQPLEHNAYYAFELHYSNPNQVKYRSGFRIFYTEKLRELDAYRIIVSSNPSEQGIVIPPYQKRFAVMSHFSATCVDQGFTIFNVLLHAHHAGRSLRLRHFRNGKELPWILYDSFYNAYYQQNRNLDKEVQVLPGDHLVMECEMGAEEEVVLGEMCVAIIYAYKEDNVPPKYLESMSWIDVDQQLHLLGIRNQTTTFDGEHMKTLIHEPPELAGELKDILSHKYNWNPKLKKLQELYIKGTQHLICSPIATHYNTAEKGDLKPSSIALPLNGILHPYVRPGVCAQRPHQENHDHHHRYSKPYFTLTM